MIELRAVTEWSSGYLWKQCPDALVHLHTLLKHQCVAFFHVDCTLSDVGCVHHPPVPVSDACTWTSLDILRSECISDIQEL